MAESTSGAATAISGSGASLPRASAAVPRSTAADGWQSGGQPGSRDCVDLFVLGHLEWDSGGHPGTHFTVKDPQEHGAGPGQRDGNSRPGHGIYRYCLCASAAASTVRMVNTAQIAYSTNYPAKGYAEDLATLGPGPSGACAGTGTAEHACQIDNVLGNTRCTVGAWCTKVGYRFSMSAICEGEGTCKDYVIVATPITSATGTKSFCSTSDALVRSKFGPPLLTPVTAEECQAWSVI